ncbi:MAG: hypothetical protein A2X25_05915 [Chloroflexi bacterium GWB2_49_20]|nr:MAG: hypothetical protein A2X25_05915 [Chloroflexi bacterium GWB2_49_20]OGN77157.1 MAG: hypothetical protein A2X26_06915 [Chloroflexi bacterium GWC2_49_37]OGN83883.1 MAG: hypothetical protein A2X27_02520 [Chloroflexi bacterium GWD2_49_16]
MKYANIRRLMMAVVQDQDLDLALHTLKEMDVPAIHMVSSGGFLGRRNATLVVGLPDDQEETVIKALSKSCHQRVEYLAIPLEGSPLPLPSPIPITVGGATIFTLPVDRFEEF